MKRICDECNFRGEDTIYFTIKKKICNSCIDIKKKEKDEKRKISKELKKIYLKKYNESNKDKKKEYNSNYYKNNKDKYKNYNKSKRKRKSYPYIKNRRSIDPLYKLTCNIRNLIKNSVANQGYSKKSKTYEILCMTYDDFKIYIESKFLDGMSWNNYGEWHLDHIIPISMAKSEEEIILLNHYTNFQPLWAKDNLKKSNSLIF